MTNTEIVDNTNKSLIYFNGDNRVEAATQTTIPFPETGDQSLEDLSDLKGKVEKFELKELVRDCKNTVKKDAQEQRSLVKSERNKLIGLVVATVGLGILIGLGVITAAILMPIVTILTGPMGVLLLPAGLAMVIGGVAGFCKFNNQEVVSREVYNTAKKNLEEKEIKASNLRDGKFVEFAKELEKISLNEKTFLSKELHDLYSTERKIIDLQKEIGIANKFLAAEEASAKLHSTGSEKSDSLKWKIQKLTVQKNDLTYKANTEREALKAMS